MSGDVLEPWLEKIFLEKYLRGYILPRAKSTSPPAIVKKAYFAYMGGVVI